MRRNPPISKIDLDMTNNCVLACDYCFRGEKNPRKLTWEVGSRVIDWLIEKSQNEKKLSVSLFGGVAMQQNVEYGRMMVRRIHMALVSDIHRCHV